MDEQAKFRHDILSAIRNLGLAVEDLESGYKFNDQFADEKIKILRGIFELLDKKVKPKADRLFP